MPVVPVPIGCDSGTSLRCWSQDGAAWTAGVCSEGTCHCWALLFATSSRFAATAVGMRVSFYRILHRASISCISSRAAGDEPPPHTHTRTHTPLRAPRLSPHLRSPSCAFVLAQSHLRSPTYAVPPAKSRVYVPACVPRRPAAPFRASACAGADEANAPCEARTREARACEARLRDERRRSVCAEGSR